MIYSVIVDMSSSEIDRIFDYKGEGYEVGSRVYVSFGKKVTEGFIIAEKQTTDCPQDKLKEIIGKVDDFVAVSPELLSLCDYMRTNYHLRYVDVLRLFIPAEMRKSRVHALSRYQVSLVEGVDVGQAITTLKKSAEKQKELCLYLQKNGATLTTELSRTFSSATWQSLQKKGIVTVVPVTVNRTPYSQLQVEKPHRHVLTPAQQNAVNTVLNNSDGKFLLHGVTGSGKTEVYLNVIENTVANGKTCIMLVPEISLTPMMLKQLRQRFGENVALLHSGLSAGERFDEWLRLKKGEAKIAVGARSAVFAPLSNLGAIIIDEEHDSSYISDFNPRYNALDVAEYRAKQNSCALILGSATPSLISFYRAKKGELKLISLPERVNKRQLPTVEIVDMAQETRAGNKGIFSTLIKQRLEQTLANGKQAMLFLNRRGYSSFLMCTHCGYVAKCADCDVSLTVHREDNELKCHFCKRRYKMLTHCPECHGTKFRQGKTGTQQVVELLSHLYPDVKVLRMDADTTQTKESHGKILSAFANGEAQILVGTQMIAKGHDFPNVTLVGILDGDQSLYYSDYLSTERTFQLLTQVAGRSGRDKASGTVVLQTYTPTHYCLQLASKQDYLTFYNREINLREASKFPPFAEIIRILYTGEKEKDCIDLLTEHFAQIDQLKQQNADAFYYLDKMRCPLQRAEKKYRFQILMKLNNNALSQLLPLIYAVADSIKNKNVQVFVERNPQNMN